MVGMTGFEPATSCSQSKRATKLRYIPIPTYYNERQVKSQYGCAVLQVLLHDVLSAKESRLPVAVGEFVNTDAFAGRGMDELVLSEVDAAV